MTKTLLIILFALSVHLAAWAQAKQNFSRAEALQVAYFTKELALTSEEAQKFWPVYYSYRNELKTARKENTDELEWEEEAIAIRKKYRVEFRKVLNDDRRALGVFKADRSFRDLLRKEQERRRKNAKVAGTDESRL